MKGTDLKCPVCGRGARLTSSVEVYGDKKYGNVWVCHGFPECHTYVGCHRGTKTPLGTLADPVLRRWRNMAHKVFDKVWFSKRMNRDQAYKWLAGELGLEEVHIGESDEARCKLIIATVKKSPYFLPGGRLEEVRYVSRARLNADGMHQPGGQAPQQHRPQG